ncbi:hypothetical protein [Parashewanella spongiae]|nr:hypothetical protein [Parashewanella spongiae]
MMNRAEKIDHFFNNNSDIKIVQRLDDSVYRINNAFFTPTVIIQFEPSDVAGFVPSAKATNITNLSTQPYANHTKQTNDLRNLMKQFSIIAIVKESNSLTNVIFGGISNNHWGIKISHKVNEQPRIGGTNSLGFKYDDVVKLSNTLYYYQTN